MPRPGATKERAFVAALLRMTDEILNREAGVQNERGMDIVASWGAASSARTDDHSASVMGKNTDAAPDAVSACGRLGRRLCP